MKVKAKSPFYDKLERVDRAFGEVFECSEGRFAEINSTEFGVLAEALEEQPEEQPEEQQRKTRSTSRKG